MALYIPVVSRIETLQYEKYISSVQFLHIGRMSFEKTILLGSYSLSQKNTAQLS